MGSYLDHPITQTQSAHSKGGSQCGGNEGYACVFVTEGNPSSYQSWRGWKEVSVSKSTLVLAPLRAVEPGRLHGVGRGATTTTMSEH